MSSNNNKSSHRNKSVDLILDGYMRFTTRATSVNNVSFDSAGRLIYSSNIHKTTRSVNEKRHSNFENFQIEMF